MAQRPGYGMRAGIAVALAAALTLVLGAASPSRRVSGPPPTLLDTGLYADLAAREVDPRHLAFAPQYPLWTDGASKRRWISLPPGTAIDASDPDAWEFPAGTRLWKEFAFGGRPVETRYIERLPDGQWLYATYEWSADGTSATLAPEKGRRGAFPLGGGRGHTIPGVSDCRVCHEASGNRVLGFSLLQLSPDRDPGAIHAEAPAVPGADLASLIEAGLLVGLPAAIAQDPPRIPAATATERAALGYLHGNCGHCHNSEGKLRSLGLFLRYGSASAEPPAIASTVGRPVRSPAPGQSPDVVLRVDPGYPERSALVARMASRWAPLQMPPLGTELVDEHALELVGRWIAELDSETTEGREEEDDLGS